MNMNTSIFLRVLSLVMKSLVQSFHY